jgi:hypothetical protein
LSRHSQHATHNEDFESHINEHFPQHYFDWKITSAFYAAYHWLKSVAEVKGIDIGSNHGEIRRNINPKSKDNPKMPIKQSAYEMYDYLYDASQKSRYMNTNFATYEDFMILMENDYKSVTHHLSNFKKYIDGLLSPLGKHRCPLNKETEITEAS